MGHGVADVGAHGFAKAAAAHGDAVGGLAVVDAGVADGGSEVKSISGCADGDGGQ